MSNIKGLWPIAIGLVFLAVMGFFTFTNIYWEWMGRPDETYPELMFGLVGVMFGLPYLLWALLRALEMNFPSRSAESKTDK